MEKKLFIGVPSLSRPEYITKKTMSWLKETNIPFKIFVEPQERFLYKHWNGGECIETLPKSGQGLMYALNYIRQYAKEKGFDYLFQIDDDVTSFHRVDEEEPLKAFEKTAYDCVDAMNNYPLLGGIRFTQYRFWLYTKKDMHKWTHLNPLMQGVCVIRLNAIPQLSIKLSEFTDTVTTLYIWKNGYFTLNYGLAGLNVVQNANVGGCQTMDRKKQAIETIEELKKDFPLVKEKESSSWFGVDVDASHYIKENGYLVVNNNDKYLDNLLKHSKFAL